MLVQVEQNPSRRSLKESSMEFKTLEEETKQIRDTFDLMDDDMMNDALNNRV